MGARSRASSNGSRGIIFLQRGASRRRGAPRTSERGRDDPRRRHDRTPSPIPWSPALGGEAPATLVGSNLRARGSVSVTALERFSPQPTWGRGRIAPANGTRAGERPPLFAGSRSRPGRVHNERMSRILLGVSGGIAAYKACELTRLLVKAGHEVVPLVTPGAERFVRAETFTALARRPAGEDLYLHLTRADLLVVAPCTANTLAKLAHGLADNLLTEAALAHRGPVLVAPAMNPRMWAHPATRANAETLRRARRRARRPRRGRDGRGRVGRRPDGRAGRDRRAAPRSCSPPAASRASACSSRPAARASRSTPPASSATARRGGWASRSPRRRGGAAPRSCCSRRTSPSPRRTASRRSRRRPPSRCSTPRWRSRTSTSRCSPPRSPTTGRRPRSPASARRATSPGRSSSSRPPTSRAGSAQREARGPAARGLRRRPRRGGARAQARDARRRRTPTSSSSTTSPGRTSRFECADNEVVLVSRLGERRCAKAPKPRDRSGDPRRGRSACCGQS